MSEYRAFRDFGPVPWWCWSGTLTPLGMQRQIDQMKEMGIDEFFIYPAFGLIYPQYLEENWFDCVKFAISEAKKRNMLVWIYDDLNWPSGTAGGKFLKKYPEYRMHSVVRTKQVLFPGETFANSLSPNYLSVFIRDEEKGKLGGWKRIELDDNLYKNNTDKNQELWCFIDKIYNFPTLGCRGTTTTWNQRGICNLLDARAVRAWMSCIHDKYYEACGEEFGKTLQGFFYDEPRCIPNYTDIAWTPGLADVFQQRFGYDIRDHFPEFYEDTPGSEKIRYEFFTLISERISVTFGKTLADWCTEHGVRSTGHTVYEEINNQNLRLFYNGENHGILKYQHIPGMDLLTDNTPYHLGTGTKWYTRDDWMARTFIFTAKQVCSTGRYSGAGRIMAEANGVCNPNAPVSRQKIVWDWLAATGVSMLNENSLGYSMWGVLKRTGSNKYWTQPWFKHYSIFADYVREMSRFATGALQSEVAVFTPETTIRAMTWITEKPEDVPPAADTSKSIIPILGALMENQIDCELMFEDVFLDARVENGRLAVPNASFRVLVLPHTLVLTDALAAKLNEFIQGGGIVVCVDGRPNRTPLGKTLDFSGLKELKPEELPDFIRANVPLKYRLTGKNEIYAALREVDGVQTLFLSNQGFEPTDVELSTTLPQPIVAEILGDETEWQFTGTRIHLEVEQSIFLRFGKSCANTVPPGSWGGPRLQKKVLEGPFDYSLEKPNIARFPLEIGLAPYEETESPDMVKMWLPVTWDGCHDMEFSPEESEHFWVRGTFFIDDASIIPTMGMVIEENTCQKLFINGTLITKKERYPLVTLESDRYEIAPALHVGENHLEMLCKTSYWNRLDRWFYFPGNFVEPAPLVGDFVFTKGENPIHLRPLPKKLVLGDIAAQGFPLYIGDVTYKCTLPADSAKVLEIPDPGACTVDIRLNGQPVQTRLWRPYRFDLSPVWRDGQDNLLEITLATTFGNCIPRCYGGGKVAPVPLGFLKPPLLG